MRFFLENKQRRRRIVRLWWQHSPRRTIVERERASERDQRRRTRKQSHRCIGWHSVDDSSSAKNLPSENGERTSEKGCGQESQIIQLNRCSNPQASPSRRQSRPHLRGQQLASSVYSSPAGEPQYFIYTHAVHAKSRHRRNTCFGFDTYPTPTMQQQTTVAHNALPPPSSTTVARSSRISVHSHIKGLGLTQDGYATPNAAGFIGQTNAREVRFTLSHPVQGENQSLGSSPRPVASSWILSSRVNSLVVPFSSSVPPGPAKPHWLSLSPKNSARKFHFALWSVPRFTVRR